MNFLSPRAGKVRRWLVPALRFQSAGYQFPSLRSPSMIAEGTPASRDVFKRLIAEIFSDAEASRLSLAISARDCTASPSTRKHRFDAAFDGDYRYVGIFRR